jgi:hypothetical protein
MVDSHTERAGFSRQKADQSRTQAAERVFHFVLSIIAVGVTLAWAISIAYGISVIASYLV